MTIMTTTYHVHEEKTLVCHAAHRDTLNLPGYVRCDVLAGDPFKGGADPKNGPILAAEHELRPATEADFERFRVQLPPDFNFGPPVSLNDQINSGTIEGYICHVGADDWRKYLEGMGVDSAVMETISENVTGKVAVIKNLDVAEDERNQGIGHTLMDITLNKIKDHDNVEATIVLCALEEENDFDLREWYEGFCFEVVDNNEKQPTMVLGSCDLTDEIRQATGYREASLEGPC